MPIVIARTGETASAAAHLTQEQRNRLWAAIVRNWTEACPDRLKTMLGAVDHQEAVRKLDCE